MKLRATRPLQPVVETNDDLENLDGALARVAQRLAANTDPVVRAAARVRKLEREPWMRLLWTIAIAAVGLATGAYLIAAGLALAVLPRRIDGVRERRAEIDNLHSAGDLLELERKSATKRLQGACGRIVLFLAIGLFCGIAALWAANPLGLVVTGGILVVAAAFGAAFMVPRLVRELRDLGGDPRDVWFRSIVITVLFLLFPFLFVFGVVRRVLGFKDPDDREEDEAP